MAWSLSRSGWRKRIPRSKPYFLSLTFLFLLSAFSPFADLLPSFLPAKTLSRFQFATIQCGLRTLADELFLWYAPHSGFSNQLGELKNAILFAAILNRTLIAPPVLQHQYELVDTLTSKSVSPQTRNIDSSTAANTIACDLQRHRTYLNGQNQVPAQCIQMSSLPGNQHEHKQPLTDVHDYLEVHSEN